MKQFVFIILLFLTTFQNTKDQNRITRLNGYAPEYAGRNIIFFSFPERQFDTHEIIAVVGVNNNGYFSFSFDCKATTMIHCETSSYTGYFYAERGRNYTISFPPAAGAEIQGTGNPFYITPSRHIMPADSIINELKDLNYVIRDFDKIYEPFINKQILGYYDIERNKSTLDSFLHIRQINLKVTDPDFFSEYVRYKTAQLEFLLRDRNMTVLYNKYLMDQPLTMNNPAFWDFYRLFFDRYISSLATRKDFKDIYQLLGKEQYDSLTLLLKNDPVLKNDTIRELVLMDELYQGFYKKDYPLILTLNLLDTVHNRSASSLTKNIASRLKNSITSLQPGYFPPPVIVYDAEDREYTLEEFKGKYLYLGFCSLNHLGSLKEIEYLKYLSHKHHDYLQIMIIVPEFEKDEIKSFTDYHSITWPILYGRENTSLFMDYKVRTFPLFYLLDKQGKLALSPSPLPSENFEQVLFRLMKANRDI